MKHYLKSKGIIIRCICRSFNKQVREVVKTGFPFKILGKLLKFSKLA